jgi:selenocysteine-specific elongation factor
MFVIATAGHVDHGKSALLRALTGMEPDRWEEERRRGLTIDLGFVWMRGAHGPIAFVDVPGHERFVGNMLAGVGPVPAVLFVVAADEGWMPQSAEHLTALDALGVQHGLLVVTKTDLMEPDLAAEEALAEIAPTSLGEVPWVGVSARTGEGLDRLRESLDALVQKLPPSDDDAPIRLWADRAFTIRGAGLVVTGTLTAGRIAVGDTLEVGRTAKKFVVREIQSMNEHVDEASGVARVALNLRGAKRGDVVRGDALLEPGTFRCTTAADVRTRLCDPRELPPKVLAHIGSATVDCRVRPLGADTARLVFDQPLPLRVGDHLVLHPDRGVAGGAIVLDADPAPFARRGAAQRRASDLEGFSDVPDAMAELTRRGIVRQATLKEVGIEPPVPPLAGDWLVAPSLSAELSLRLSALAAEKAPLKTDDARKELSLPDVRLVPALLPGQWTVRDGMIVSADAPDSLAPVVRRAVEVLEAQGFAVPGEEDLNRLGLTAAALAAAARAGRLIRLAPDVVLTAVAVQAALVKLAALPQPFTASQAREALGTTRKVAVPLLEHLAREGRTRRDGEGHRVR